MIQKTINIKTSHKNFMDGSALSLSRAVRQHIEAVNNDEREVPSEDSRRSPDEDYVRTTIVIDDIHQMFLERTDAKLSHLADDAIGYHIERERKLTELDE